MIFKPVLFSQGLNLLIVDFVQPLDSQLFVLLFFCFVVFCVFVCLLVCLLFTEVYSTMCIC